MQYNNRYSSNTESDSSFKTFGYEIDVGCNGFDVGYTVDILPLLYIIALIHIVLKTI